MNNKKNSVNRNNSYILKLSFEIVTDRCLHLIKNSLETGAVPDYWMESLVIAIERKGGTIKCEEFRYINMVLCHEKELEVCVHKQLPKFAQTSKMLSKYQAGFRKNNLCESAS